MATIYRNSWILKLRIYDVINMFQIEVPMFSQIFGDNQLNTEEMAAAFRNPRWRRQPSLIMVT